MLIIREQQMKALEDDILVRWIVSYLQKSYGSQAEHTGPASLRGIAQKAVVEGRARGLVSQFDLRKFAHIIFLLGPKFESDPSCQWACDILDDAELGTIGERVRELETKFLENLTG